MSETVLYTVAREGAPTVALGEGWTAPVDNARGAYGAAVETARQLHKSTLGEHHVVREERVRNQGGVRSNRTVFSTRTGV